jgi:hypothetical protein
MTSYLIFMTLGNLDNECPSYIKFKVLPDREQHASIGSINKFMLDLLWESYWTHKYSVCLQRCF